MKRSLINERGISHEDYYNRNAVEVTEQSPDQRRGVLIINGPEFRTEVKKDCQGITKKGTACKAAPVGGQMLCAGHYKQQESRN